MSEFSVLHYYRGRHPQPNHLKEIENSAIQQIKSTDKAGLNMECWQE